MVSRALTGPAPNFLYTRVRMNTVAFARAVFIRSALIGFASFGLHLPLNAADAGGTHLGAPNTPVPLEADGHLRFDYGPERLIQPDGLQPSMICTKAGTLVVQGQTSVKALPGGRMKYPSQIATSVSRDGGVTWTMFTTAKTGDTFNMEGGIIQLPDGTIMGLDTYVTPDKSAAGAYGQIYTSNDEYRTLRGPVNVPFDLPKADYFGSKDDNGRPHVAERVHRRIIMLPDHTLLGTIYGVFEGDRTPATYEPNMMKSRVVLIKSSDLGKHWSLVSVVAVDPSVGTEGFGEPVVERVSSGDHAGRLICLMRTGRNIYEAHSDDVGLTWSHAVPLVFAGHDVTRTELWVDMFRDLKGRSGKYLDEKNPDELQGAATDPDLLELRSGLLVATFGIRIPEKAWKDRFTHPWNGNYLAVSRDHGATWSNVIQITSGIPTTHYTAIAETPTDNQIFMVYDHDYWGRPDRYLYGRTIKISTK